MKRVLAMSAIAAAVAIGSGPAAQAVGPLDKIVKIKVNGGGGEGGPCPISTVCYDICVGGEGGGILPHEVCVGE